MVTLLRHLRAFGTLPFVVTVVIPSILYKFFPNIAIPPVSYDAFQILNIGYSLFGVGLYMLVKTNLLFHKEGEGTLAPFDPPKYFVVSGPYLYSRNPMIGGVFFMLAGEFLILNSIYIAGWLLLFVILKNIYLHFHEEPELEQRFGDSYRRYRDNVPMWFPRLTPYKIVKD